MAVSAWAAATEPVLEGVASAYGGSITYERLGEQLFEQTGYRTRMLLGNWIGQVLGPVQTATLAEGKPPLSSLVVRAETGGVGDGYVNHQNPQGFATFAASARVLSRPESRAPSAQRLAHHLTSAATVSTASGIISDATRGNSVAGAR